MRIFVVQWHNERGALETDISIPDNPGGDVIAYQYNEASDYGVYAKGTNGLADMYEAYNNTTDIVGLMLLKMEELGYEVDYDDILWEVD